MADIVLKDGSGESQTYAAPNAIGVDTADGGMALFYREDVIPAGYTHPATHPASMITGLSAVATDGTYGSLRGKPCGDLDVLIHNERFHFTEDPSTGNVYSTLNSDMRLDLIAGKEYRVIWDGEEYICLCRNYSDGIPLAYIGNKYLDTGDSSDDTGEPFLMYFYIIYADKNDKNYTVTVEPLDSILKLDKKYLPDEVATKKFVIDEISKIADSGGSGATEVDIFPESKLTGFVPLSQFGGAYVYEAQDHTTPFDLAAGDACVVVWDGEEWDVTVQDAGHILESNLALGNGALFDLDSNDEPFGIVWDTENGCPLFVAWTSTEESHTVRIYKKTSEESNSQDGYTVPFFDLAAMGLPAIPLDGAGVYVQCETASLREALGKSFVKLSYAISVGGVEMPVSGIVNAGYALDTYQCNSIVNFDGLIVMLTVAVHEASIFGEATILAAPATTS